MKFNELVEGKIYFVSGKGFLNDVYYKMVDGYLHASVDNKKYEFDYTAYNHLLSKEFEEVYTKKFEEVGIIVDKYGTVTLCRKNGVVINSISAKSGVRLGLNYKIEDGKLLVEV